MSVARAPEGQRAAAAAESQGTFPAVPPGAILKEEDTVPPMPPCAFVNEEGAVPPMPPNAFVKVEAVVKEEASSEGRPKRQRKKCEYTSVGSPQYCVYLSGCRLYLYRRSAASFRGGRGGGEEPKDIQRPIEESDTSILKRNAVAQLSV